MRLVRTALRCYPERWRNRHGEEAAELATLLMRDGKPAWSIAWSYLKGAASTRLVLQPRRRVGAAVGALLAAACSLGISLALLSSSPPANAANVVHSGGSRHCGAVSAGAGADKTATSNPAGRHGRHC